MSALATAAKGKGAANALRRARAIRARYGFGPERMEQRIKSVLDVVEPYGCRATLPITAAVVARHPRAITSYAALGIEFPVHGLWHVDHAALSEHAQLAHLARARNVFEREGLPIIGFRAPYLRWNDATLRAIHENGFLYDGSQAMHFRLDEDAGSDAYGRVLDFCGALSAEQYPVVPWTEAGVVRIPYVLPDDESIVDRLGVTSPETVAERWLQVFATTHDRGELFTLAVHPERIETCGIGITAVLDAASRAELPVWTTRHEEIARWWRDRGGASVIANHSTAERLCVTIKGPVGLTLLARRLDIPDSKPWADGYEIVQRTHFDLAAEPRPFIGVHPLAPDALTDFLRDQGYIVETSEESRVYSCFLERRRFSRRDQRPLLEEIEQGTGPLLRFGRWPHGAHSALSITGDIDALTLGDYAYRILGR
jgi:peptidoglycan/xylan/chitin deacetylase (PgdA/CDA1 family)